MHIHEYLYMYIFIDIYVYIPSEYSHVSYSECNVVVAVASGLQSGVDPIGRGDVWHPSRE